MEITLKAALEWRLCVATVLGVAYHVIALLTRAIDRQLP